MTDTRSVEEVIWVIVYDDADKRLEFFTGEGAADAAHKRYQQMRGAWDCHLLGTQTAILASLKDEGMVVVPIEPSKMMLDHVTAADQHEPFSDKTMRDIYRAMISAAEERP